MLGLALFDNTKASSACNAFEVEQPVKRQWHFHCTWYPNDFRNLKPVARGFVLCPSEHSFNLIFVE
jgi:hypothetical protein